jgi:uncharacterized membrane protein required for colicin V production
MDSVNGLDFAIVFAFLAIIGLGFFGGITRVLAAMFAIYVATVVSAMFYSELTDTFRSYVDNVSLSTAQLFIFMVTFLITALALGFALFRGFSNVRERRRFPIADNLGGVAMGITVSALAVALAIIVLSILLQVLNQTIGGGGSEAIAGSIGNQLERSALAPVLLDVSPVVTRSIQPWFPDGLPAILG